MKIRSSVLRFCILLTAIWLLCSAVAIAQTVGASIQGIVTDSNGAALPSAKVETRNVATGAIQTVTTDSEGRYRLPLLQSGNYELRVTAAGFQPLLRRGITLAVG